MFIIQFCRLSGNTEITSLKFGAINRVDPDTSVGSHSGRLDTIWSRSFLSYESLCNKTGPVVIKFVMHINIQKQTIIVDILTFVSKINYRLNGIPNLKIQFFWVFSVFLSTLNFMLS